MAAALSPLSSRIIEALAASRVPLAANEIGHRLHAGVAEVMIALYELEQAGTVEAKISGLKGRTYYRLAD